MNPKMKSPVGRRIPPVSLEESEKSRREPASLAKEKGDEAPNQPSSLGAVRRASDTRPAINGVVGSCSDTTSPTV